MVGAILLTLHRGVGVRRQDVSFQNRRDWVEALQKVTLPFSFVAQWLEHIAVNYTVKGSTPFERVFAFAGFCGGRILGSCLNFCRFESFTRSFSFLI